MRLITTPDGTVLKLFGTAKEMPSRRYSMFQKKLLLQAGVGSDLESISGHFSKLYGYVSEDMKKEALGECENLHFSIYSVLNSIDFTSQAFACLVFSIGDVIADDISEDGLQRTSDSISSLGVSIASMEELIEDIKKKIGEELKAFFPRIFPDDLQWSYFEKLKQKIILTGELLLQEKEPEGIRARLAEINRYFLEQTKPLCFKEYDPENCLIDIDRNFGALAAMLDGKGATNSQDLPLFDFYARLEFQTRPAKS